MTLFEEARLHYFGKQGLNVLPDNLIFPFVLLKTDIRFLKPGKGGVNVIVDIRTVQVGNSSFTQQYRVRWAENGEIWSEAEAVLVCFDFGKNRKMEVPDYLRTAICRFEGLGQFDRSSSNSSSKQNNVQNQSSKVQLPITKKPVQFESNYDESTDKIQVGMYAQVNKCFGMDEVRRFADLSEDHNPIHLDEQFARETRFGRPIVHGQLYTSLISALAGMKLPGKGAVYVSQYTQFKAPVFLDDEVIARVEVTRINHARRLVTLSTTCKNRDGKVLMTGEAILMVPAQKLGDQADQISSKL